MSWELNVMAASILPGFWRINILLLFCSYVNSADPAISRICKKIVFMRFWSATNVKLMHRLYITLEGNSKESWHRKAWVLALNWCLLACECTGKPHCPQGSLSGLSLTISALWKQLMYLSLNPLSQMGEFFSVFVVFCQPLPLWCNAGDRIFWMLPFEPDSSTFQRSPM